MSSQQKRGFRLPWAPEPDSGESAGAATLEDEQESLPARLDLVKGAVGDGLGEGPFHFADEPTSEASTDASPEAPDVPETTGEAAMIDTESPTTDLAESAPSATDDAAWPTSDQRDTPEGVADAAATAEPDAAAQTGSVAPLPPIRAQSDPRAPRSNPLVAGLVKAMREAAIASREETTTRVHADATARVVAIREAGTAQAAELRKRADEDIAGIREWSKAEIARIRQETDDRIEGRRTELTEQTKRHEGGLEQHVEQVQTTVAAFEADMERFFEQLLSETDPARLASLAEKAPEPPDLEADALVPAGEWQDVAWTNPGLEADAAAEAEAAATEGLDLSSNAHWPASVARPGDTPSGEDAPEGAGHSRLIVNGLTSVAGISAFKGAIGQLPGVRSVSVSSGEPGVFIFTVIHEPDADLQTAVAGLTQFSTLVTEASGDSLSVTAHEPAA
jgi:hypothetical protein